MDNSNRSREDDGRFQAGFDRVCVCGHTLGVHTAARPHECIAHDFADSAGLRPCVAGTAGIICRCEKFKPARRE